MSYHYPLPWMPLFPQSTIHKLDWGTVPWLTNPIQSKEKLHISAFSLPNRRNKTGVTFLRSMYKLSSLDQGVPGTADKAPEFEVLGFPCKLSIAKSSYPVESWPRLVAGKS